MTLLFCESVTATDRSPWCIRRATTKGAMLGGGVDTDSLCGRVRSPHGWDLRVRVTLNQRLACPRCVEILREEGYHD